MLRTGWNRGRRLRAVTGRAVTGSLVVCGALLLGGGAWGQEATGQAEAEAGASATSEQSSETPAPAPAPTPPSEGEPLPFAADQAKPAESSTTEPVRPVEPPAEKPPAGPTPTNVPAAPPAPIPTKVGESPASPARATESSTAPPAVPRGLRFEDGTKGQTFRFIERPAKDESAADPSRPSESGLKNSSGDGPDKASGETPRKPAPAARFSPGTPADHVPPGTDTSSPSETTTESTAVNGKSSQGSPSDPGGDPHSTAAAAAEQTDLLEGIHAASFQGITPGEATEAEVVEKLGEPRKRGEDGAATTLTYELGPFPQVDFHVAPAKDGAPGKVGAIVVHLKQAAPVEDVVSELALKDFRKCRIPGAKGETVGHSFPDRGIQLLYGKATDAEQIRYVVLELIAAEPFVLRAAQETDQDVDVRLRDLAIARRLDPRNGRAAWLAARLHAELGNVEEARGSLKQALAMGSRPEYRLLEARLAGFSDGRWEEAVGVTREVLAGKETSELLKARAECQLGDLLIAAPQPDPQQALAMHQAAITRAKRLVEQGEDEATGRLAREILVDAHAGAAHVIARGPWQGRPHAVARWLDTAATHAENLFKQFGHDPLLQWRVLRAAVAAHDGLQAEGSVADFVDQIVEYGESSLKRASGPRHQAYVREQLGRCLFDAMRVAYVQQDYEQTRKWGERALAYLEPVMPFDGMSDEQHYQMGRALFLIGSCHAHDQQDHELAVVWYERAIAHLDRPLPAVVAGELGRHGQRFVTMGVSYWHAGSQREALKLTVKGGKWMEQAVGQGRLDRKSLAIPYGNLANMHRSLGNGKQAEVFTAQAQAAEKDETRR